MTTNKPEVVAYHHSNKTNPDIRGVSLFHDPSCYNECEITEPLIRLSDYEALQAECEKLRAALKEENEKLVSYIQNGIECFANPCLDHSGVNTPPFSEFQERYGSLCLMCVVDELEALKEENERLNFCPLLSQGSRSEQGHDDQPLTNEPAHLLGKI